MIHPTYSAAQLPSTSFKNNVGELGVFPECDRTLEIHCLKRKIQILGLICLGFCVLSISVLYLIREPLTNHIKSIESISEKFKNSTTCSPGYTYYPGTKKCLKVFRHPHTLHMAWLICLEDQAFVASIHDIHENEFILKLWKEAIIEEGSEDSESIHPEASNFWLGLIHLNNKWLWIDGTAVTFTNWKKRRPAIHMKEVCSVVELKNGKWKNVGCHLNRSVVCQKQPL